MTRVLRHTNQGCCINPSGRNRTSDQLISEHTDIQHPTLQSIALPTELHSVPHTPHTKRNKIDVHAPTLPFTSSTMHSTSEHTRCTCPSSFDRSNLLDTTCGRFIPINSYFAHYIHGHHLSDSCVSCSCLEKPNHTLAPKTMLEI